MSCYTHQCSQPSREREVCTVFSLSLEIDYYDGGAHIDGRIHSKFHRLRMSGFFYAVGESLLDDDKYNITTGDITYITSFGIVSVLVLDIRLITPQMPR